MDKKDEYYGDISDVFDDTNCDLRKLEGATILRIGMHRKSTEGGLTIWYEKDYKLGMVVLGFNDLGIWFDADIYLK